MTPTDFKLRLLNKEQIHLLLDLEMAFDAIYKTVSPYPRCAIAGGYFQGNRPAKDVDIFLHLEDDTEGNETLAKMIDTYIKLGFTIVEDFANNGYGDILLIRVSHKAFGDLPIQIISRYKKIVDQIEDEFPLSLQQVAYLPVEGYYFSSSFDEHTASHECKVHHSDSTKFIEKYKEYYPDWTFV